MELTIHVPKEQEAILAELETEASTSGRPKNQIVLEALVAYLENQRSGPESQVDLRGAAFPEDRAAYEQALRDQHSPEHDAPREEHEAWRRIREDDARRRFSRRD